MQNATLAIAVGISILILILRPHRALAVLLISILWYPTYMVFYVGTFQVSVTRVAAAVLLVRCVLSSRILRRFTWSRLDTWVTLGMCVYVITFFLTRPLLTAFENRSGFLLDTWVVYLVVRFCLTQYAEYEELVKWLAIALGLLAILGLLECLRTWAPFESWLSPLSQVYKRRAPRWGLLRAQGPFSQPIMFGIDFVVFLPLIYGLRAAQQRWRIPALLLSAVVVIGALSSMSSGPWAMLGAAVLCLAMERYQSLVRPLIIGCIFLVIVAGIISNRPVYYVIASYANPLGGAGWHRAKLIDCAIQYFHEWWLLGYGDQDPGWGHHFGMNRTDITNEFVLAGVRHGILGVVALCGVLVTSFRLLMRAHRKTGDLVLQSLYWSLGSTLVAIVIAFISVSFFGPPKTMFYCILGMIGASQGFAKNHRLS